MSNNIFSALQNETTYDDDSSSDNDICLEITECIDGVQTTSQHSLVNRNTMCHNKRLLCNTVLSNTKCRYNSTCKYAHSLKDQIIDFDKEFLFKIILDKNLSNYNNQITPKNNEIYTNLKHFTTVCDLCINNKCTGGFNCKYGVNHFSLKLCKNDLLTGACLNKIVDIILPQFILDKFKDIECINTYVGCLNGHHLTDRGMMPYCEYVHLYENSHKKYYSSIRYIDLNFPSTISDDNESDCNTTSSSDSEMDQQFHKLNTLTNYESD